MLTKQFDVTTNRRELEGPSSLTRIRVIIKLIQKYRLKGNIIDIGCRTGGLIEELSDKFRVVVGIDISRASIHEVRRRLRSGKFFVSDITDSSSLPKMLFDVAVCSDVLEHIKEDVKALENINRILKPKGHLIVTTPFGMKNWTRHDNWARHIRRYELNELQKKLKQSGFNIEEIFIWGYPIYNTYYKLILQNVDPTHAHTSRLRKTSRFLNNLFQLDDLFTWTHKGRRLFAVVKKTQ